MPENTSQTAPEQKWERCEDCAICTYGINSRCFLALRIAHALGYQCRQGRKVADRKSILIQDAINKRQQKTLPAGE